MSKFAHKCKYFKIDKNISRNPETGKMKNWGDIEYCDYPLSPKTKKRSRPSRLSWQARRLPNK